MAVKNSIKAIPLSSIDSATFTGAYQLLSGAAGITNACFMLRITNNSTVPVTVSYDGVNDHDFVLNATTLVVPPSTISQPNNFLANFAQGQKVYVKSGAGVGLVYLAGYFQPSAG